MVPVLPYIPNENLLTHTSWLTFIFLKVSHISSLTQGGVLTDIIIQLSSKTSLELTVYNSTHLKAARSVNGFTCPTRYSQRLLTRQKCLSHVTTR
jgi:hypothetical protein